MRLGVRKLTDPALPSWNTRLCRNSIQGPIDYALYEAYGGGAGKAVSAILNNSRATRIAIGVLATMVVRAVVVGIIFAACFGPFFSASCSDDQALTCLQTLLLKQISTVAMCSVFHRLVGSIRSEERWSHPVFIAALLHVSDMLSPNAR